MWYFHKIRDEKATHNVRPFCIGFMILLKCIYCVSIWLNARLCSYIKHNFRSRHGRYEIRGKRHTKEAISSRLPLLPRVIEKRTIFSTTVFYEQ